MTGASSAFGHLGEGPMPEGSISPILGGNAGVSAGKML